MAKITTWPVFNSKSLSAGDSGTSGVIDLRHMANAGFFSLSVNVNIGTSGTCGTTVFTYSGCSTETGIYRTPSAAVAIGTCGTNSTRNIISFYPELMPFMKIIASQTGSGTSGFNSKIDAELIIQ
jgi:hypothetical protein